MTRTLLVPAPHLRGGRLVPYLPLGLLTLQAVAEGHGHSVDILLADAALHRRVFADTAALAAALLDPVDLSNYEVVGLSSVCDSLHHSLCLAAEVRRRHPPVTLLMGGPQASAVSAELAQLDAVDGVVVGEGERTLVEILDRLQRDPHALPHVPGLQLPGHPFTQRLPAVDLDPLPSLFEARQYGDALDRIGGSAPDATLAIEAARGCPGRCRYCSTRRFWGGEVRRKSAHRLLEEMLALHRRLGCTDFELIGDDLGSPRPALWELCQAVEGARPALSWRCDLRLSGFRGRDLGRLWRGGCRGFFAGIESASQVTLDRLRKGVRLADELSLLRRAVRMGFAVHTSLIVGFPWETAAEVTATYRLHCDLLSMGVERSTLFVLCPLPGTDLTDAHPVRFDASASRIAMDGLPDDDPSRALVRDRPSLFPQLGYLDTPAVDRPVLLGARDAAEQMSAFASTRRESPA